MADKKISELDPVSSINLSDLVVLVQGGITSSGIVQQIVDQVIPEVNGPIIYNVGEFLPNLADATPPLLTVATGSTPYWNMVDDARILHGGFTIPPGYSPTIPLAITIQVFPLAGTAGTITMEFAYTKTALGAVPGSTSMTNGVATTTSTLFERLETTGILIALPTPGSLISFSVRFLNGSSTFTGAVGLTGATFTLGDL